MTKIVPIDKRIHLQKKIRNDFTLKHTKEFHMTTVVIHEYVHASHDFPIVFVKDNETGQFRSAALMGLRPGDNYFCHPEGWQGDYVPESLRAYPFVLSANPNSPENQVLCFDEECDRINETEGQPLFNEKGEQSEYVQQLGNFMLDLQQKQMITNAFVEYLLSKDLLVSKTLELSRRDGKKQEVTGLYVIDEEKFNKSTDEEFLEYKAKNYLVPMYASLMSLSRVNKLIKLSERVTSKA